jgi:hypothetical protein
VVGRKPPSRRAALRDQLIDELRERRAAVLYARAGPTAALKVDGSQSSRITTCLLELTADEAVTSSGGWRYSARREPDDAAGRG